MSMFFAAGILSGISFEAQGMDNAKLFIGVGVGTATLIGLAIKNTATYKTYNQHTARLAQEKERFDNPLLDAQPLFNMESQETVGNEKLAAFLKEDQERRNAYNQQTKKNDLYWNNRQFIDSYEQSRK